MSKIMNESKTAATVRDDLESMFLAIASGDSSSLAKLIDGGTSVDAMSAEGHSATMKAAMGGQEDCLRLLVKAGADVDAEQYLGRGNLSRFSLNGWTAAMFAAKFGNEGCIRILASAGANLNATACPEDGWNATMVAARFGQADCIRALASAGADLNAAGANGQTAAMAAARFGKANSLRALAERGADLARVDSMGETAADKAVRNGDTACAEMIRAFELARDERAALATATAGRASFPTTPSRARSL